MVYCSHGPTGLAACPLRSMSTPSRGTRPSQLQIVVNPDHFPVVFFPLHVALKHDEPGSTAALRASAIYVDPDIVRRNEIDFCVLGRGIYTRFHTICTT